MSITITQYPQNQTVSAGSKATFRIVTKENNLKYKWYYYDYNPSRRVRISDLFEEHSIDGVTENGGTLTITAHKFALMNDSFSVIGGGEYVEGSRATLSLRNSPNLRTVYTYECDITDDEHPNDPVTVSVSLTITGTTPKDTLQYEWSKNIPGTNYAITSANTLDHYIINVTPDIDGYTYTCSVYNDYCYAGRTSDPIVVIYREPKIITQPTSKSVQAGTSAIFSIYAKGTGLSLQWEQLTNSGWIELDGQIKAELIRETTAEEAGNVFSYRCKISNKDYPEVYSNTVQLTVLHIPPKLIEDVENQETFENESVTFSCVVEGEALSFQWYKSSTKIPGTNTNSYTFIPSYSDNNKSFYCEISNTGGTIQTRVAMLQVKHSPPTIIGQPQNITKITGDKVTLDLEASGEKLQYSWYRKNAGESKWNNVYNSSITPVYTFTAYTNMSGNEYYCSVRNDGGEVRTNTIILTVKHKPPIIKSGPKDVTIYENEFAEFYVSATYGTNDATAILAYQWQRLINGVWTNIQNATLPSYEFQAQAEDNYTLFKCLVSTDGGEISSGEARLTVQYIPPTISVDPSDLTVYDNKLATFHIEAIASVKAYQWQKQIRNEWKSISGANEDTYSFIAHISDDKSLYKCIVSNNGGYVESATAMLNVLPGPIILTQPTNQSVYEKTNVSFSLDAKGESLTYQWQKLENEDWINIDNAKDKVYSFKALIENNGTYYRCHIKNDSGEIESDEVLLEVKYTPPNISRQPVSLEVYENSLATFTVAVSGEAIEYTWQTIIKNKWTDIPNTNSPTYSFTATLADDNSSYRCIAKNTGGSVTFNEVILTVLNTPPSFIIHPKNKEVDEHTNVTLAAEASGNNVDYQWQTEADNVWIDIVDASEKIYTFKPTISDNGKKYRCIASNNGGSDISNEAVLTVNARIPDKPVIITQPRNISVHENTEARFTIELDSEDGNTYQWQEKSNEQWANIYQEKSAIYVFTPVITDDQKQYRCEIKNNLYTIYSDEVTLTVLYSPPKILTEPISKDVHENTAVSFSVYAEGERLEYKWQRKIDNKWHDIPNTNFDTYSFIALIEHDDTEYHCIVENNGGKAVSLGALLNVKHAIPKIQNILQDQSVYENTEVTLAIDVIGDDISYQWQKKTADSEWTNISGDQTNTYTFIALYRYNETSYRCIVENDGGSDMSNEAYLTVLPTIPTIISEPADQLVTEGKIASFSVVASGIDVNYQWKKKVNDSVFIIPDATRESYSFTASIDDNNALYFCQIYNKGGSINSNEAKLTIKYSAPIIQNHPTNITVFDNEDATLSIDVIGDGLTYLWQRKISGLWEDLLDSNSRLYTFTAYMDLNKSVYQCIVENNGGKVISNPAIVTVKVAPPKIIEQPVSLIKRVGEEAVFEITVIGNNYHYKWQRRYEGTWITVSTKDTYSYMPTTNDYEQTYTYQCVITDDNGNSVTSDMFTLTVLEALPIITDQSPDQLVYTGENIELFVTAAGKNLQYQWYIFNSNDWAEVLDAARPIYIKEDASDADNNTRYKCKVENNAGYVMSKEILITVCPSEPIILRQPTSITVLDGDKASFAVEATGKDIRYQWQSSIDQGTSWNDVINTNVAEYSFLTSMSITGYQYRCIVTNGDDISIASDPATLTVNINNRYSLPVITTQPSSVTITEGESVSLTIDASDTSGSDLGYQWQIKRDDTYYAITDATEPTYVVIGGVSMSGSIYRCVVSNPAGAVISNEVSVIVQSASAITMPTVVNQPTSIAVLTGTFSGFRLYATGGGLTYQWYRQNGGVWYPVPDATSPIYETTFAYEKEGSYRCEITNVAGTVFSNTVTASIVEETNLDVHGYHSIFISGKNTYAEWEMYPTSRPHVASPEVKTNYVNLPGANGGFDYTELLVGQPTYGYRKGSWEFMLIPQERWADTLRSLENYLHGRVHTIVLEDDLSYEYTGRLSVNKWESLQHNSTIVIDYTLEPVARNRGGETFNPDESDLQAATRILMKPEHANDAIVLWHNTANIVNLDTLFEDGDDIAY